MKALGDRIERDYRKRIGQLGGSLTMGGTPTEVRMEIAMGDKAGPVWGKWVKYARRRAWFGPQEQFRDPGDVEKELRAELDAWIAEREKDAEA